MATPENTEGRFQQIDLALAEIRDDAAKNAADQGHNNVDLIVKTGSWPHDWEFPKGGEIATEDPFLSSWSIRIRELLEKDEATGEEKVIHKREIFSPLWRTKNATHVANGCLEGAWSDLPDDVKIGNGTLYAVLKITISAGTYESTAFDLTLTTDISSVSDTPVVPPDPSSTGGGSGTDGIYHLIVPIGRFSGSADDGGATGFEQWHVGVIAEDFMPRRTLAKQVVVNAISVTDNKLKISKREIHVPLPFGETLEMEEVELPSDGSEGLPNGTLIAWEVTKKTYSGSSVDETHPDGSVWLRQSWRVWSSSLKKFVSSSSNPDTDICRLDTLGSGGGWCVGTPEIVNQNGKLYEVYYWWKLKAPTADGQPPTFTKTTFEAKRIELLAHGSDHTEGVL